ncbi:adenylate/guanylate cyclase [Syntrophotalea carbinolica DSM 2380]|uniref:Adenylate/guanylate cyclase n=1 Tax=Syntrophotalea carbinolica (strain DSM 2380 / NBRC 103641 / GraBd1) TaxID=338963 RepID=Q3A5C7_SYNC1|nr:AAA family ATPase [Syntrophotalea carbinolica]ABA88430.1 adenylate/guanylate cyclase [Syntrophotalea carbinolica DSM 2380]
MKCPKCGFDSSDNLNFCGRCGERLHTVGDYAPEEPSASAEQNRKPQSASRSDGMAIIRRFLTPQLADKILSARGKIEGERRQVTALFADLKGYTPLSEALGEEAIFKVMERVYEGMITAVLEEEGSVQELTGDGIFALFGAPIALEDAPLRACRAALALQNKLKVLGEQLERELGVRPLARIGIHTGPVIVGTLGTDLRMEFKAVGDTINLASRLESIADPGCVFISATTHRLADPFIVCSCVGERKIKGKKQPQQVYRLESIKEHAVRFDAALQRGLTPLAGRSEELDLLHHYQEKVGRNTLHLVLVIGEAGVGKSRLVHEFKERMQSRRVLFLQSNCTSCGSSISLMPFIHLVKDLFRIQDDDDRSVIKRKLTQGLELFGMDSAAATPYLMTLIGFHETGNALRGLDAKIVGERTREILVDLLRNRSRLTPTILVIEDLHWIDPASEKLLGQMAREKGQMPLLILCTTRPSFTSPWSLLENVREMQLKPLSRESTMHMVRALLDCDTIDESLARVIFQETGCNPLYTEEMTRFLLENGAIRRLGRTATCEFSAGEIEVPPTVLDLLQTRVDRLQEEPKGVLQIAAVIGQRFSPSLARQVSELGDSFDRHLGELEKLGLIFREQAEEQVLYRFKHALLQDAVYNSLLQERREELHQAVAETMERVYTDRLSEWAHTIAYHWGNTRDIGKAVQYLVMAGEKSYWVGAMEEAHERFCKAVDLIEAEPGCVDDLFIADVLLKWTLVFVYRADFKSVLSLLERYLPRMETLGDKKRLSLILSLLAGSYVCVGRGDKAKPLVERAMKLAEESDDLLCIGHAARVLAWLYNYWTSDCGQSDTMVERYYNQAIECAGQTNDIFIFSDITSLMANHLISRGRIVEARAFCSKFIELGQRFRDNRFLSQAQSYHGFINFRDGRYQEALENAEQALQLSPDRLDDLCALAVKGGALARMGKVQEGLEILHKVRDDIVENKFVFLRAPVDMYFGAALVLAGQIQKGVCYLEDAIKYWASLGNYTVPTTTHRILGDIYRWMALGKMKLPFGIVLKNLWFIVRTLPVANRKARRHYQEVVRSARDCHMPSPLARGLYGLGVLSMKGKEFEKARAYLEEAIQIAEGEGLCFAEKVRKTLASIEKCKR